MTWACCVQIVEKLVCWQHSVKFRAKSLFPCAHGHTSKAGCSGPSSGKCLCAAAAPARAALHTGLNKDISGCSISEMHLMSFSLQMEGFPAEPLQHPLESLWNKELSLAHCRILGCKSVHFLKFVSFGWWLWEVLLKERKQQQDTPSQALSFSFCSHLYKGRRAQWQHSDGEERHSFMCSTPSLVLDGINHTEVLAGTQ